MALMAVSKDLFGALGKEESLYEVLPPQVPAPLPHEKVTKSVHSRVAKVPAQSWELPEAALGSPGRQHLARALFHFLLPLHSSPGPHSEPRAGSVVSWSPTPSPREPTAASTDHILPRLLKEDACFHGLGVTWPWVPCQKHHFLVIERNRLV